MLLNELSEGDDSSSERRRSQSIGSESESESDASHPTNLDVNGILGAIIHGPPNKSLLSGTPEYSRLPPSAVTANIMERARPHNRSKKNKKRLFSASFGRNTTILFVKYTDKRIYGKLTCLQV
jgi:hypothetical protein